VPATVEREGTDVAPAARSEDVRDAPLAEITAAAPRTIAAMPATTPRTASISGDGQRVVGTSKAHMLAVERPPVLSSSKAGSCTTGMSGTVVTGGFNGSERSCRISRAANRLTVGVDRRTR
jgi:hypothetical protein